MPADRRADARGSTSSAVPTNSATTERASVGGHADLRDDAAAAPGGHVVRGRDAGRGQRPDRAPSVPTRRSAAVGRP